MTVLKWEPLKELMALHEKLNRAVDQSMVRPGLEHSPGSGATWSPPVDVYETEEVVVLKAELPGLERSDIRLEVVDSELVLSGERRMDRDVDQENFLRIERGYGKFRRAFELTESVRIEDIDAKFKNGVLEVVIPKHKENGSQKIEVK